MKPQDWEHLKSQKFNTNMVGLNGKISVGPSFSLFLEDYGKQTNLIKNHKIKLETQKKRYTKLNLLKICPTFSSIRKH